MFLADCKLFKLLIGQRWKIKITLLNFKKFGAGYFYMDNFATLIAKYDCAITWISSSQDVSFHKNYQQSSICRYIKFNPCTFSSKYYHCVRCFKCSMRKSIN